MRAGAAVMIVIVYLVVAVVVGALDPSSDPGSAVLSGLLWPLAALAFAWDHMASFFGPMFG